MVEASCRATNVSVNMSSGGQSSLGRCRVGPRRLNGHPLRLSWKFAASRFRRIGSNDDAAFSWRGWQYGLWFCNLGYNGSGIVGNCVIFLFVVWNSKNTLVMDYCYVFQCIYKSLHKLQIGNTCYIW